MNQAKEVVRRVAAGNGKQSPEHLLKNASNKVITMMMVMMMVMTVTMMRMTMTMNNASNKVITTV